MATEGKPSWAQRLASERRARNWTQRQAIDALRLASDAVLPDDHSLLRMWKGWEAGSHRPSPEYQRSIASALGTVSAAIFGPEPSELPPTPNTILVPGNGLATMELVQRIRRTDIDGTALDTLRIIVERLCSEYSYMPSDDLRREGRGWLARLTQLLDSHMTLAQHREVLVLAGWLTLLVGCVEYDMRNFRGAEATRQAAMSLGEEAGHNGIMAWSQEMTCWFSLTQGQYRQVVEASRVGREIAPQHAVSVQLAAQEAKAWARMGDRRQVELALERGRLLLESLPYPENVNNHFAIDPDKFDFYAMDCYRRTGENSLATMTAEEVIRKSTAPDGTARTPMRIAEAKTTLAVVAAREGDLEAATNLGLDALDIPRQSVPSLLMVSQDLVSTLRDRYGESDPAVRPYFERLQDLAAR